MQKPTKARLPGRPGRQIFPRVSRSTSSRTSSAPNTHDLVLGIRLVHAFRQQTESSGRRLLRSTAPSTPAAKSTPNALFARFVWRRIRRAQRLSFRRRFRHWFLALCRGRQPLFAIPVRAHGWDSAPSRAAIHPGSRVDRPHGRRPADSRRRQVLGLPAGGFANTSSLRLPSASPKMAVASTLIRATSVDARPATRAARIVEACSNR